MSQEIKECPFCGMQPEVAFDTYDLGGRVGCANTACLPSVSVWVGYDWEDGKYPLPPTAESKKEFINRAITAWNRRATVSLKTAQELADALQLAKLNMLDAKANGIGQGGAIERAQSALTRFDAEKGRG